MLIERFHLHPLLYIDLPPAPNSLPPLDTKVLVSPEFSLCISYYNINLTFTPFKVYCSSFSKTSTQPPSRKKNLVAIMFDFFILNFTTLFSCSRPYGTLSFLRSKFQGFTNNA